MTDGSPTAARSAVLLGFGVVSPSYKKFNPEKIVSVREDQLKLRPRYLD
jgi:hypothetical protein